MIDVYAMREFEYVTYFIDYHLEHFKAIFLRVVSSDLVCDWSQQTAIENLTGA